MRTFLWVDNSASLLAFTFTPPCGITLGVASMECSFCSLETTRLDSHHLIPRYLNGNKEDIIEVDRKHHRKIEILTQNFLKWGSFDIERWNDDEEHWLNDTCEWCGQWRGQEKVRVFTHHLVPRYLNGSDNFTIELCMSCHRRFESYFWNFLWWGNFKAKQWQDPEKSRERQRKYLKNHPEQNRKYYLGHQEKLRTQNLTYYYKHRQNCLEKMRERRRRNVKVAS